MWLFNNYSTISPPQHPHLLSWKQWIYSICSMMYIKTFLTFGFPHFLFSQTTLYSEMEGCNWLSSMGKFVWSFRFIRSSEEENPVWSGVEQFIISAMYGSSFFLSRLLMIFMALSTSLHVTSKDSVGCLSCGWNHIWLQIACIQGMNMRVYCRIQLLEAPMSSKDLFCKRLFQKKTAHSIYLSQYTWSNNQQ